VLTARDGERARAACSQPLATAQGTGALPGRHGGHTRAAAEPGVLCARVCSPCQLLALRTLPTGGGCRSRRVSQRLQHRPRHAALGSQPPLQPAPTWPCPALPPVGPRPVRSHQGHRSAPGSSPCSPQSHRLQPSVRCPWEGGTRHPPGTRTGDASPFPSPSPSLATRHEESPALLGSA